MQVRGLLQDAREAVCELANCSVKNFSSLTRFSGLQDFLSWRTRSASSEKKKMSTLSYRATISYTTNHGRARFLRS